MLHISFGVCVFIRGIACCYDGAGLRDGLTAFRFTAYSAAAERLFAQLFARGFEIAREQAQEATPAPPSAMQGSVLSASSTLRAG